MKRKLLSLLVLTLFPIVLTAQSNQAPSEMSQHVSFDIPSLNGLPLHGTVHGEGGLDYTAAISVSALGGNAVLHRLIIDHTHHLYFGYDLSAYRVEGTQQVHLHFTPVTSLASFGTDLTGYTPGEMVLPADSTIAVNSTFEVPLEKDQDGHTLLRDRLTFGPPNP
ncbi:MAG TPA: hypothetical protein VHY48_04800 [Acidobacteriaceae bacterium]|jgi:hypothetical protein|nr:hypothetical protein [Acidobacteriaceae bacterium]